MVVLLQHFCLSFPSLGLHVKGQASLFLFGGGEGVLA